MSKGNGGESLRTLSGETEQVILLDNDDSVGTIVVGGDEMSDLANIDCGETDFSDGDGVVTIGCGLEFKF